MANRMFILGDSGTGKSTSMRNLDPKETFVLQCINKELPFKGWKKKYVKISKENMEGNRGFTKNYNNILKQLNYINDSRKEIKTIVIDDSNYLMTDDFMGRVMTKTAKGEAFQKYNEMAFNFYNLMNVIESLRDDLTVIMMSHTQTDDYGNRTFKTVGKLLDNTIVLEGLVSVILETCIKEGEYKFQTNLIDGTEPCKTPLGMFEDKFIDNDLKSVIDRIREYEEEE